MAKQNHRERGVALVLVIMALLLLSAIGIGMLCSADSETAVAANYRDRQVALYAAQSGLQEARERLRSDDAFNPTAGGSVPAGIPGTTAAGLADIIYILNPGPGETIEPWRVPTDSNPNPYYDSDVCSKLPAICDANGKVAQSSGYTAFNHGTIFTSAYTNNTNYKWVRVMLKTDNMIANVPVQNGTTATPTRPADGNQVCYDPSAYVQFPRVGGSYASYGVRCMAPDGQIAAVTLAPGNAGGYNYLHPTVTIAAPPGGGTTATATVQTAIDTGDEHITSIIVTDGGTNYKSPPIVTIDAPLGINYPVQATAKATIDPGGKPVASATVSSAGSPQGCYSSNTSPTIIVSPAAGDLGTGAAITAAMTGKTCVYSFAVSGSCSSKKKATGVAASMTGGFTGTLNFNNQGYVTSTAVTNPGSGISALPTSITVSGCTGLTPTNVLLGYQVSTSGGALSVTSGGGGYATAPTLTFQTPSAGAKPTATATLGSSSGTPGRVTSITITNPGGGYTVVPHVTLASADGFGSGATAVASVAPTTHITGFTITDPGSGYHASPAVTISDAAGTGAQAVAVLPSATKRDSQVFLLTSLARAPGGAVAMAEMETARTFMPLNLVSGALVLGGPSPNFSPPNSANMVINGRDANSCGDASAMPYKPALGVYDDPNNVTSPTAVQMVTTDISTAGAKPANFIGLTGSGDVSNIYDQLGPPATAAGYLSDLAEVIKNSTGTNKYATNPGSINMGTATTPTVDYVNGDFSISGSSSGYGVLVVTGTLTMSGNFSWHGPILVVGDGNVVWNGGGNGQITGMVFVANTHGGSGSIQTLDSPDATWAGGGGNGIRYDHCWADNQLKKFNLNPPVVQSAMKILSVRNLSN
jgi:PilX N-terminal